MEQKKSEYLNIHFVHKGLISFFMAVCLCVKNATEKITDKIKTIIKNISLTLTGVFLCIFSVLSLLIVPL